MSDQSKLEEQVTLLQKKLNLSKSYRVLAEWFNNVLPSQKLLLKSIPENTLLDIALELNKFSIKRAEEIETGEIVEDLSLTKQDLAIIKQFLLVYNNKMKNKQLGDR